MTPVTWLSPGDPTQRTGGYIYNARMIESLQEMGVAVSIVVLDGEWPLTEQTDRFDHQMKIIEDGNVVVADGLLWSSLAESSRQALCRRCAVWVVMHTLADKEVDRDRALWAAERELAALEGVHGWFATSDTTASELASRLGQTSGRFISPGTDGSRVSHDGPAFSLLSVGHLIPRKGHDRLISALAKLQDIDWSLRIVGSTERDSVWAQSLVTLRDELGLTARIEFVGECSQEELEREYAQAGVLLHTPHYEAYGMVLTEALARGLPVMCTPSGAIDDWTSDAVFVVNDDELVSTLRRWLTEVPLRERAIEAVKGLTFPSWSEQAVSLRALLGLAEHDFSTEWLRQREPFDHSARSKTLLSAFSSNIPGRTLRLLDIATGLGSGARFVNRHIERSIQWVLLDHDATLLTDLTEDMRREPGLVFQTVTHDLEDVDGLPSDVDGVTTQALLDLVSEDWLNRFAQWLVSHRLPLLAALSVDGRMEWTHQDKLDERVKKAFRTHQTWDRGFGSSPGILAVSHLVSVLELAGFSVETVQTDWLINSDDQGMMVSMIDGIAGAAKEAARSVNMHPDDVENWRQRRLSQLGELGLRIGHLDLLALPPKP